MRKSARLLNGRAQSLGAAQPFRDLVAQARLGAAREEHEAFFRDMLADVSEPTLPFGLTDVHHDGSAVAEARVSLPASLNTRLRTQARKHRRESRESVPSGAGARAQRGQCGESGRSRRVRHRAARTHAGRASIRRWAC